MEYSTSPFSLQDNSVVPYITSRAGLATVSITNGGRKVGVGVSDGVFVGVAVPVEVAVDV